MATNAANWELGFEIGQMKAAVGDLILAALNDGHGQTQVTAAILYNCSIVIDLARGREKETAEDRAALIPWLTNFGQAHSRQSRIATTPSQSCWSGARTWKRVSTGHRSSHSRDNHRCQRFDIVR